jgi:putative transcriptional regulator
MRSIAACLFVALLLAAAPSAFSQAPSVGRVLVANPALDDPNFSESVLLIVFHDTNIGTAGVFLNRPTWIDPIETFSEITTLEGYDGALYLGGPAAPTDLWLLFEFSGLPIDGTQHIAGPIYVGLDPAILSEIDFASEDRPKVRLYAGRAEWGPGQLAEEIAAGNWRTVPARPQEVFADDPANLWQRMPLSGDGVRASLD